MNKSRNYRKKFISSMIGKAIGDYNLIADKDRILIAVSGGKDSLTLLKLLMERKKWSPAHYELYAAHIETDFYCSSCVHKGTLEKIFKEIGIEYVFRKITVLDKEKKTNCFWCSWNRRKTLFEIARDFGCNKVALGHHKDDIAETTLLNLLFKGEFSTMNPRQELFGGKIVIIRPLCYVEEEEVRKFAKENNFPSKLCKCPFFQESSRKYIKGLIKKMEKSYPGTKTNIFKSIRRIKREYLNL